LSNTETKKKKQTTHISDANVVQMDELMNKPPNGATLDEDI